MSNGANKLCSEDRQLTVVVGRCRMNRAHALRLLPGQFMPLDEPADWPVEIYAAGQLVARGELLTLNDRFCVRVTETFSSGTLSRAA